jgi:hypothetical protein
MRTFGFAEFAAVVFAAVVTAASYLFRFRPRDEADASEPQPSLPPRPT